MSSAGQSQKVELNHVRGEGDYDYTFTIALDPSADKNVGIVIDDSSDITGVKGDVLLNDASGYVIVTVPKAVLKTRVGEELYVNLGATTRAQVHFEATPSAGPGSFVLKQSNDKIKIWSAETGGVELTKPNSLSKSWDLDDSQLAALNATNRIWIEGLEVSDELGDTTITLEYLNDDDELIGEVKEVAVTLLKMNLEAYRPWTLAGYRTPDKKVLESEEDVAENLLMVVNDDNNDQDADGIDMLDDVASSSDNDLVKIIVSKSYLSTGLLELTSDDNGSIKVFDSSGNKLPEWPVMIDLENPQGAFANILSGDVNLFLEGVFQRDDLKVMLNLHIGNTVYLMDSVSMKILESVKIYSVVLQHPNASYDAAKNYQASNDALRQDHDGVDGDEDVVVPLTMRVDEVRGDDKYPVVYAGSHATQVYNYIKNQDAHVYVTPELTGADGKAILANQVFIMDDDADNNLSQPNVPIHEWFHANRQVEGEANDGHNCTEHNFMWSGQSCSGSAGNGNRATAEQRDEF